MANELEKYGLKFWLALDIKNKYLFNAYPYRKRWHKKQR